MEWNIWINTEKWGEKQMFLYDKAAIYDGMIGNGLFTLN